MERQARRKLVPDAVLSAGRRKVADDEAHKVAGFAECKLIPIWLETTLWLKGCEIIRE